MASYAWPIEPVVRRPLVGDSCGFLRAMKTGVFGGEPRYLRGDRRGAALLRCGQWN